MEAHDRLKRPAGVATITRDEHAEAGALLLEALADRDDRSAALADEAVVVVSELNKSAKPTEAHEVRAGFSKLAREAVTIPHDPAMADGLLRYDALRKPTQQAWLRAAAAITRSLKETRHAACHPGEFDKGLIESDSY